MNSLFENHLEEINLIINRLKKESQSAFVRLQKASVYNLELFNGQTLSEDIYQLEGMNVHQITKDGKVLLASSDRIYLTDIATRLYQDIGNILKSYKSHKVHSKHSVSISDDETSSKIKNIHLYEWNNDFLKDSLTDLYRHLDKNVRDRFDIVFKLEGYYSLWNIFNHNKIYKEFDEYVLCLNYSAELKETGERILSKHHKININEVVSTETSFKKLVDEVNSVLNTYLLNHNSKDIETIDADVLVLDDALTSKVIAKLLLVDTDNDVFSHMTEKNLEECINEEFDKFGSHCNDRNSVKEGNRILRQCFFYENPEYSLRNLILDKKFNKKGKTIRSKDLKSFLHQILEDLNLQKIIFLKGSRDVHFIDEYSDDIIIEPSIKLYFDGKDLKHLNFDLVEITKPNEIKLIPGNVHNLYRQNNSNLFVGIGGFSYSLLPLENVKFI